MQIVFALTSNPLFVRERTITQQSTQEVKEGNPMKKTIAAISIAVIGSLACPVLLTAAEENEETVQMSSLPAAVQTTIKDKAGSNEIVKIEKKTEEGKTVYEAVLNKKGKEWSIEVDANGKFLKQYQESKEKEEKGEKY
ncbi:MAG: hypothetical protein DME63_02220 [Verrucomicrobia bacterium]|nr:MAG: hypothetical protein DME63_02220 [Verrucomicrobiota bacterium]